MASTNVAPLKYHGGKNYLASRIVSLMPRHLNYCEPYCGGGSVLFARDPDDESLWLAPHKGVSEVVNDLSGELTNFWRVLQDEALFERFRRRAEVTPFSGLEFVAAQMTPFDAPEVDRAWAFFVVNRQSLAGRMKAFTGITKTRTRSKMNNEVSAWLNVVAGLPEVHQRLRRVLILPPQPALDVIAKFDLPETLFYLDPPYLHETRASTDDYAHEMTEGDHRDLLAAIRDVRARVILSGYSNALYNAALADWDRHEIQVANHAAAGATKRVMTEVLWTNYAAPVQRKVNT